MLRSFSLELLFDIANALQVDPKQLLTFSRLSFNFTLYISAFAHKSLQSPVFI